MRPSDEIESYMADIHQMAEPGMGGHLPGEKVTREIAEIRGFKPGESIISPIRAAPCTQIPG